MVKWFKEKIDQIKRFACRVASKPVNWVYVVVEALCDAAAFVYDNIYNARESVVAALEKLEELGR